MRRSYNFREIENVIKNSSWEKKVEFAKLGIDGIRFSLVFTYNLEAEEAFEVWVMSAKLGIASKTGKLNYIERKFAKEAFEGFLTEEGIEGLADEYLASEVEEG